MGINYVSVCTSNIIIEVVNNLVHFLVKVFYLIQLTIQQQQGRFNNWLHPLWKGRLFKVRIITIILYPTITIF